MRPIAIMASAERRVKAICAKERADPCCSSAYTASVFINDDERGLLADHDDWLEELTPHESVSKRRHNRTGEDNADPSLRRQSVSSRAFDTRN